MYDKCPKCSNNSFRITTGDDGQTISKCLKCGATAVFAPEPGASETKPAPPAFGKGVA